MMKYGFGLLLSALSALLIATLGLLVLTDSSAAMLAVLLPSTWHCRCSACC